MTLEQSKKLAEILPLESADCFWDYDDLQKYHRISWFEEGYDKDSQLRPNENNICAWSLAALLSVLPDDCGIDKEDGKYVASYLIANECGTYAKDNPIDTCYEMILKLHELKKL